MQDLNEGIVEQYAAHLLKRASSVVVSFTVAGTIGGAALGAAPGLVSHSVISPGANYFAVLLGAVAGGFLGRSIGDRRALGLRLQAQMALRQLQLESRFVTAQPAPAVQPAAPAPVSSAAAAPPAQAPPAQAPPAVRAPMPAPPAVSAPSTSAPAPAAVRAEAPVATGPTLVAPSASTLPPLSPGPS